MKKLLSLILALMLCVGAVPALAEYGVIGGADGPTEIILSGPGFILPGDLGMKALAAGRKGTTVMKVTDMTGINTGSADIDAALTELIKALGITVSEQQDEAAFALTISGKDVLTLGIAADDDEAYIHTNLLGGTMAISADEVEGLLSRLMDMLVLMEAMTAEDAAAIKEQAAMMGNALGAALGSTAFNATLTDEDLLALDYSAITTALGQSMQKMQPIEEIVVPRNYDAAVGGFSLTMTNEDVIIMSKAMIQFVKDNPKVMAFAASQFGMNTQAQLAAMWDALKEYSAYATEEEFWADNASMEDVLDAVLAELDGKKVLDGDYVIRAYYDEAGLPVYATFTLPLFTEFEPLYTVAQPEPDENVEDAPEIIVTPNTDMLDALEPQGETTIIEVVYARQTVAQGVSHVVNVSVDEETLTIDTLVNGNNAHIVLSAPDEEPVIIDAVVDGNRLTATMTYNPDEETAITCDLEGSYLYTETEYVLTGKLTLVEVFTPAETETPALNGMTLPGFEARKPQAKTNTIMIDLSADYDLNGVDFTGVSKIGFAYNDVHVALQADSYTSDPEASIVAGDVVRPAELDDAAFANWFVGVINTFNSWTGNLLMSLPESVLTMLVYSGMY